MCDAKNETHHLRRVLYNHRLFDFSALLERGLAHES